MSQIQNSKKIKTRGGRISRLFKIPIDMHEKIKIFARDHDLSLAELCDRVIGDFVDLNLCNKTQPHYLLHQGKTKFIGTALTEETVSKVKTLASRDSVAENRVMFTALAVFYEEILGKSA